MIGVRRRWWSWRRAAWGVAALACASGRLTGKDVVRLSSPPADCAYVATISGVNPWGSQMESSAGATEWAEEDAAEKAAALGATHLVLDPTTTPARASGKAYRCERSATEPPAGTAPAPAGCTKDVDCKGERICEAGRCVFPPPRPSPAQR